MVDVHHMTSIDEGGLLNLLNLHRRAEPMGMRVLVVGWQPQPQQLMADVAGIPGPGTATAYFDLVVRQEPGHRGAAVELRAPP